VCFYTRYSYTRSAAFEIVTVVFRIAIIQCFFFSKILVENLSFFFKELPKALLSDQKKS
jgi:hypothetical protein